MKMIYLVQIRSLFPQELCSSIWLTRIMAEALQENVRVATYLRALGDVSAYKMKAALLSRRPPLDVSVGVLKQWVSKYRPCDAVSISGGHKAAAGPGGDSRGSMRKKPAAKPCGASKKRIREKSSVYDTEISGGQKAAAGPGGDSCGSIRKKPAAKACGASRKRIREKSSVGSGSASSTDPVVCRILKRPAASTAVSGPLMKRTARAAADVSGGPTCMDVPGILVRRRGAQALEVACGTMLREYGDISAYRMKKELYARATPLEVPEGILKQWIYRYRLLHTPFCYGMGGLHVHIAKGTAKRPSQVAAGVLDLNEIFLWGQGAYTLECCYGKELRGYGDISAYKLKRRLYTRATPLEVPEGIIKQWILKYRLPATTEVIGDNTSGLKTPAMY